MPKTSTSGKPPKPSRSDPASDRYIPGGSFQGKIEPNFYCRAWNTKRQKYCAARAGQGTDHPGEGRCRVHGGEAFHAARYTKIQHPRLVELIAAFDQDPDPLDLLPELALLRALVVDFVNRHEELMDALLAWHHSFSEEYLAQYSKALRRWLEEGGAPETFMPPVPIPVRPRKVLDITAVEGLLQKIGQMVAEIERTQNMDALPRHELVLLTQQMGRVVEEANSIPDAAARLTAIKQGWLAIRTQIDVAARLTA